MNWVQKGWVWRHYRSQLLEILKKRPFHKDTRSHILLHNPLVRDALICTLAKKDPPEMSRKAWQEICNFQISVLLLELLSWAKFTLKMEKNAFYRVNEMAKTCTCEEINLTCSQSRLTGECSSSRLCPLKCRACASLADEWSSLPPTLVRDRMWNEQ